MDLALQAFFAALFTSIGGLVVWFFQSRAEKLRRLEESLQDRRLALYSETLDPFIKLFAGVRDDKVTGQVMEDIQGHAYRKTLFDVTMFGSDEVVQALNALWTHIYEGEAKGQQPREIMRLWANLLLAVRRSAGNPDTKLEEWDMLAAQIKDIDSLRNPQALGAVQGS